MLYNYQEALEIYGTDYKLKQALSSKKFFRIEKGIYSDKKNNYTKHELILKKYSHAFLVKDSALFHIGFINQEPETVHLGTTRSALRIHDKRVTQHFYGTLDAPGPSEFYLYKISNALCRSNVRTYISADNSNEVRLFNLSALFADLLRDRRLYSRQQFIELVEKFGNCKYFCDENLYHAVSPESVQFDFELLDIIEDACSEARSRQWRKEWDLDYL